MHLDPKTTLAADGIAEIVWQNPRNITGPIKFELLSGEEILAKLDPAEDLELDNGGAADG